MRSALLLLLLLWMPLLRSAVVGYLGPAGDSTLAAEARADLRLPADITFECRFTGIDPEEKLLETLRRADVLIVNARSAQIRALAEKTDFGKTRLYALSSRLLKKEIPAREPPEVKAYWRNRTKENFRNMILWIVKNEFKRRIRVAPPAGIAAYGVAHPASARRFRSVPAFREWAEKNGLWRKDAPAAAIAVHTASVNPSGLALFKHLTDECRRQGLNAYLVFGDEVKIIRELLLTPEGKAQADVLLALSFKFRSGLNPGLMAALRDLDLPVFNILRLYRQTTAEWRTSPRGMNDFSVAFGFIAPELSGLIEPSLLFGSRTETGPDGRKVQTEEPFPLRIRATVARAKKWIALRRKPNGEKRIALFIHNGAGGKQNIGASYLNVPRSLVRILKALHDRGYDTGRLEKLTEEALTAALLKNARNVGPWAPGELEALIAGGETARLPLVQYKKLFGTLPETFRRSVTAEWGPAEKGGPMFFQGNFVVPVLKRGHVAILPEPMRGWLGDPHKLLHSRTLAPPHQYTAVYLYLKHVFKADAVIHLGRHGTAEFLPGKQLGLDAADAPAVIGGDMPVIYPYISDGIGEGILAKRRAQAVMIAHLTPFLKPPEAEKFLPELRERIDSCRSADPNAAQSRREALKEFALRAGLGEKLQLDRPGWFHRLEDYAESRTAPAPFGLHAFGLAPDEPEIRALLAQLPEKERSPAERPLRRAGDDELDALLHALSGGYVRPGPSGDLLRNVSVLPSGRNFHAFDPTKLPSPEALRRGEKLASELLEREKGRLGRFPRTAAVLLWAGESVRTDGLNEALALALMGMTVKYDASGRLAGVVPIPGARLGRPRIDVLITASGAYRDQFGAQLQLLENARRQAARLRDGENFILADRPGIFFPAPGSYGTRISRLAGASGLWEKEDELARLYLRSMAWTVDADGAFTQAPGALAEKLKHVETLLQSRSSNVYGVTDVDEMYQYMGGLALAAKTLSGRSPRSYIADDRHKGSVRVAELKSFLAAELDSRLYSKAWLQRMMKENYAGAKLMARMTDNLWGWQAVTPENVSPADWNTLNDIFVKDRYGLKIKEFFDRNSPWAYQSVTARMLEAVRKGYWKPPREVARRLAAEYAGSVAARGVACCDHTCNNPLLNRMVLSMISLPGVLSPDLVMKFQAAVEKAGGRTIDRQVRERRQLQSALVPAPGRPRTQAKTETPSRDSREEAAVSKAQSRPVKGFRMKEKEDRPRETSLTSSGLKWTVLLGVFLLLGLFFWGFSRREE